MRSIVGMLVAVTFVLAVRGPAAALCQTALAEANKGYAAYAIFKREMFDNRDTARALEAYVEGAVATRTARAESCAAFSIQGHVLGATAAMSITHATIELDAATDNGQPACPREHRDVAKADVANAWIALLGAHFVRPVPDRFDELAAKARMLANRLGMKLPPLDTGPSAAPALEARYGFHGQRRCSHTLDP